MEKDQNGLGISDEGVAYTLDGTGAQSIFSAAASPAKISPSPAEEQDSQAPAPASFHEFARVADALVGPGGWVLIENGRPGFRRRSRDGYFGVPQRRRRAVQHSPGEVVKPELGQPSGRCAQQVLLEPESGGGDFEAGREARPRTADRTLASPVLSGDGPHGRAGHRLDDNFVSALDRRRGGADDNEAQAGHLVAGTVRSHMRPGSNSFDSLAVGHAEGPEGQGRRGDRPGGDAVAKCPTSHERWDYDTEDFVCAPSDSDRVRTPPGAAGRVDGAEGAEPRASPFDPTPDGPRYAGCGDAVTANVAEWIGGRILNG